MKIIKGYPAVHFVLVAMLMATTIIKAQTFPGKFITYSLPDGLPDNNITAIAEDKYGYTWIGTPLGLVRFDGKYFTSFNSSPTFKKMPSKEILSLQNYGKDEILVVTRASISIININNMSVSNLVIPARPGEPAYKVNNMQDVLTDDKGNIFATTRSGFYHFNAKKQLIFRYDDYEVSSTKSRGFGVYVLWLTDQHILMAGQQNFLIYNTSLRTIENANHKKDKFLTTAMLEWYGKHQNCFLFQAGKGAILALPYHTDSLIYINESKKILTRSKIPADSVYTLFSWRSAVIPVNDSLYYLAGKNKGLYPLKINSKTGALLLDTNCFFPNTKCNTLFINSSRLLWLGCNSGLKMEKNNPINLRLNPNASLYEPDNNQTTVLQVAVTPSYVYAASTASGGINRFNRNNLAFDQLIPFSFPPFGNKKMSCIRHWSGDSLLCGTDAGLFLYTEKNKQSFFINIPGWNPRYNWVSRIMIDRNKNAWITTNKLHGFYIWTYGQPKPDWIQIENAESLKMQQIYVIQEGTKGEIWLGGQGLARYNKQTRKIDFYIDKFSTDPAKNNMINAIACEEQKAVWAANTDVGLIRIDTKTGVPTFYDQTDDLQIEKINALTYLNGQIWIQTKNTISTINTITYQRSEKINNRDVYFKQFHGNDITLDGSKTVFYTGAGSSIIRFEPGFTGFTPVAPKLVLVFSRSADSTIWFPTEPLSVNWNKRVVTLFVNAINYQDPDLQRYSYRVINTVTSAWVPMEEQRRIVLTNLQAGKNIIELKVVSNARSWNDQLITYKIYVIPPFYRTVMFKILCILAGLSILYFLYKNRQNQQLKITAIRDNISKDLHDEVGSTLSGIAMYSHMAQKNLEKNDQAGVGQSLTVIQQSAREMVTKLNDMIWIIKPQNESLEAVAERLKIYLTEMAAAKGIQTVIQFDPESLIGRPSLETRKNIYLICKEALNNAVKYSGASQITFLWKGNSKTVSIRISDNGCGFDSTSIRKGNGLENMFKRASDSRIKMNLVSSPDNGCLIQLEMKITQ